MVQSLINLGADPNLKNHRDLLPHQCYVDAYGMDKAALHWEKALYFDHSLPKTLMIGSIFHIDNLSDSKSSEEAKNLVIKNWKNFINDELQEEKFEDDLEIALQKTEKILEEFEQVQNTTPLNAYSEFNSEENLKKSLKKKQWEVVGRDILNSFSMYH